MANLKSARGTVNVSLVSPSQSGALKSDRGYLNVSLVNPAPGTYAKSGRGRVSVTLVQPPGPGFYFLTSTGARRQAKIFHKLPDRDPTKWAWATTSPWNMPLGSNAEYEARTDPATAQVLDTGVPEMNSTSWSVARIIGTQDDPLATVTSEESSQTWQIRIPSDAAPTGGYDGHMSVLQVGGPDDGYVYEFYAATRIDATHWRTRYNLIRNNLRGSGIQGGRVAGAVAQSAGIILAHEVDQLFIPHGIALTLKATMMKKTPDSNDGLVFGPNGSGARWVWPANNADNQTTVPYAAGGLNPMGSVWAIPPSVNLNTLGLSPQGLALGKALQNYPMIVTIQGETISLRCEPTVNAAAFKAMQTDWKTKLFKEIRRIKNFKPGTLGSDRIPLDLNTVGAWTGTPRAGRAPSFS